MKALSKLAVVFIILGAVMFIGPTFGFSSIAAERGAQISVSDGTAALLGIDDNHYDGSEIRNHGQHDDRADVIQLTNNFGHDIDTVDVTISNVENVDDNVLTISNQVSLLDDGIGDGNQTEIELACSGDVEAESTETVTVTIVEARSNELRVENKQVVIQEDVTFKCQIDDSNGGNSPRDPEPIEGTDLEISGGNVLDNRGGTVGFDLTNTGEETVDDVVTHIEVRSTTADAHRVSTGGNDLEVEITVEDSGEGGSLNTGGRNSGVNIGGGLYELDDDATINGGDRASFRLTEFTGSGNGRDTINMNGEDVTIVLDFENRDPIIFTLENL